MRVLIAVLFSVWQLFAFAPSAAATNPPMNLVKLIERAAVARQSYFAGEKRVTSQLVDFSFIARNQTYFFTLSRSPRGAPFTLSVFVKDADERFGTDEVYIEDIGADGVPDTVEQNGEVIFQNMKGHYKNLLYLPYWQSRYNEAQQALAQFVRLYAPPLRTAKVVPKKVASKAMVALHVPKPRIKPSPVAQKPPALSRALAPRDIRPRTLASAS